jgi:hypothetical protein
MVVADATPQFILQPRGWCHVRAIVSKITGLRQLIAIDPQKRRNRAVLQVVCGSLDTRGNSERTKAKIVLESTPSRGLHPTFYMFRLFP